MAVLCALAASPLHAAGTTSAAFLRLGSGARASGMGDTFAAVADDASATYWNPAGLSSLTSKELLAEHSAHIQNIAIERIAYAHPFRSNGRRGSALGISGAYLSLDGIEARTGNTAQPDAVFGASDFYTALTYSHPLSLSAGRQSSFGINGKLIRQQIGSQRAQGYALDFGYLQQFGKVRVGATVANIGPGIKFVDQSFPLPQTLRLGASYHAPKSPLTTAIGFEKTSGESAPSYRLGAEYGVGQLLAFRMGYLTRSGDAQRALKGSALGTVSDNQLSRLTGLVGGVGFRMLGYGIDYAFLPYGELGSTHQISLTARFK